MQRQTLDLNSAYPLAPHVPYSPATQQHSNNIAHMRRGPYDDPNDWEATASEGLSQLASKPTPNMYSRHSESPNGQPQQTQQQHPHMISHAPLHPALSPHLAHMQGGYPVPPTSMMQSMGTYHPAYAAHLGHPMMTPMPTHLSTQSPHSPHSPTSQSPPSSSSSSSEALDSSSSPQKVRTERYIKVIVRNMSAVANKALFLSWFLDNNGLPDSCMLLIPERHPNAIINFKGINGWIEIDTKNVLAPDFPIEFELKLQHSFLNRKNNLQNQPIALRFFLLDKQLDGSITCLGEILLNVILMSAKCSTKALVTKLTRSSSDSFHPKNY